MNNIRDNRQASKDERFSEAGREINKDIAAPKRLSQITVVLEDFQIVRTANANSVAAGRRVYVVYLVFIESVTMVPRDPLVQSRCTKEQPYARAN